MKKNNLSFCALEVKNNDYYRYICCLFAPEYLRERLFTLYAFNHEIAKVKDIVSEPMIGMIRLAWWREALDEIYSGKQVRKHEVTRPLQELVNETGLPREFLEKIIDAREQELNLITPANIEALKQYIDATSTSLLLASLYIVGIKDKPATDIAYHIGTAYSLVGIMRAARWNAGKRYILFPKDMLDKNNITEDDIAEGRNLDKTKIIVQQLCDNVEINLRQAYILRKNLPAEALPVYLHTTLARFFLNNIIRNDYDLFYKDLEKGKLKILLKIFLEGYFH